MALTLLVGQAISGDVAVIQTDGSTSFAGGVDSIKTTTVASPSNPNGLNRDQLGWLCNATVRDGGISPRNGWVPRGTIHDSTGLFQDAQIYIPSFTATPYILAQISGHLLKIDPDFNIPVQDLSSGGLVNPPTQPIAFMQQAQEFMVIQAGDYGKVNPPTLPLFWDGSTLRRSAGNALPLGIVAVAAVAPAVGFNVVITLTAPYAGAVNQIVVLNGNLYVQVAPANFYTIKNLSNANTGQVMPSGTLVTFQGGAKVGKLLASFVVPAIGATVNVKIDTAYTGPALPVPINILSQDWQITSTGTVAPGPNQVYLVNLTDTPGAAIPISATLFSVQELPAATCMDYFQGRLWYAQGRLVAAGDIVGDQASGTLPYNFRDSVLKVTENPLAVGGDGFYIPDNSGDIRAIKHSSNLDATLGEGNLYIGSSKQVYSLSVPITRAAWIAANTNNQPVMKVVQINNGMVGDRSVVPVNGDLFYQCLDPSIRSLQASLRYFGQWSNNQISANEDRILKFNDRSLMRFSTGVNFNNRLLQAVLPRQVTQGVVHDAIIPLDFTPISSFGADQSPVWEGHYEGLPVLKLLEGDFGGRDRCFAIIVSKVDSTIQLWELTDSDRFDSRERADGGDRIPMYAEFPAFNNDRPFDLKDLVSAELWFDDLFGTIDVLVEYRPDGDPCWHFWTKFRMCSARNSCETVMNPVCYPLQPARESYRATVTLPKPPIDNSAVMNRPLNRCYQAQVRTTIKGWVRVRGLFLKFQPVEKQLYENMSGSINFVDKDTALPDPPPPTVPQVSGDILGSSGIQEIFGP